jgi:hypothetical protein
MTTALEGGEWSAARPGRTLPKGKTRYSLYRRMCGPQSRSGQVRKISPPPGFAPRIVQPVVGRYTDELPGFTEGGFLIHVVSWSYHKFYQLSDELRLIPLVGVTVPSPPELRSSCNFLRPLQLRSLTTSHPHPTPRLET